MSATSFSYNGVTVDDYVKTYEHSRTNIYSDDGIDYLYTEVRLSIGFVLSPILQSGTNSVTQYKTNLEKVLMQPRGNLSYTVDGVEWINQTGQDVKKGPLPDSVDIEEIAGKLLRVRFTITTWVIICDSVGASTPNVLSNRWSMASSIDRQGLTTRTTSGRLIVNGDRNLNVDDFRAMCMPPKPRGFDRTFNFMCTTDGLQLEYTITDTETHKVNPFPIVDWAGTWTEVRTTGSIVRGQIQVRAKGIPSASPLEVLQFCVAMASSRIDLISGGDNSDVILNSSISEDLASNEINLTLQVLAKSLSPEQGPRLTRVGAPVDVIDNAGAETDPGTRANYLAKLFVAAANTPCIGAGSVYSRSDGIAPNIEPEPEENTSENTSISIVDDLSTNWDGASEDQKIAPYTTWKVELDYQFDHGLLQLPVANSSSTQSAIVSVSAPLAKLKLNYVAERYGKKPDLPARLVDDDNYKLAREHSIVENFSLAADGITKIFRIDGEQLYFIRDVSLIDVLKIPFNPTVLSNEDLNISNDNFNIDVLR